MVLESTMICVDNSEYMRNGDFVPTRLQAQQDAANLVSQCKVRGHPENGVGLIAMAERVDVLSTLTQDVSKIFAKLHQISVRGNSNFLPAIRIAHLALKHRQNRNQQPRIVIFVGSPMDNIENEELIKQAKKLKKEKVNVDVVCFGESDSQNSEKMTVFIDTLNGKDGTKSHLVVVPAGSNLNDALLSSPICRGEDGAAPPVGVGGGGAMEFDANDDPELAMALRVSLEEQRRRQEEEARRSGEAGGAPAEGQAVVAAPQAADGSDVNAMTEEQQLAWALQMSMQESAAPMEVEEASGSAASGAKADETKKPEATDDEQLGQLMADPAALQELISSIPGVDPNSDVIKQAMQEASAASKKPEPKPDEKKKDADKK